MDKIQAIVNLRNLDLEFCNTCKKYGAEGWVKFFSDNGVMATSGGRDDIIGKTDIFKSINKIFTLDNVSFTWEPIYCDVSDDLTLGYTSGTSTLIFTKNDKKVIQKGKYSTIWKKIDDEWKIILDLGN